VRALREMLNAVGHSAVVEVLDWFFNASVRNAFAHADYALHDGSFRAPSESFEVRRVETRELPLAVLPDLLNRALAFTANLSASVTSSLGSTAPTNASLGESSRAQDRCRWNPWSLPTGDSTASDHRQASHRTPGSDDRLGEGGVGGGAARATRPPREQS
jgi:hypothetical protein